MASAPSAATPPVLSERELQVLRLVATGVTNNQIARELAISPNTVKVHLNNIFTKLGVQSRTEASLFAVRQGWVEVDRAGPVDAVASVPAILSPAHTIPAPTAPTAAPLGAPHLRGRVLALATALGIVLGGALYPRVVDRLVPSPLATAAMTPGASPQIATPQRWQTRTPLRSPREAMAVATLNGMVYVFGGLSADGTLTETLMYDPAADRWEAKSPKPTATQGTSAAVIGGRFYLPGGCDADNKPSGVLEIYDPTADSWQVGARLPQALCHYAISATEGRLYLFGGWNGVEAVANVWSFDPSRGEWSELAPLPSARMDSGAAVVNEQVYVIGGRNGERLLNEMLAFDPAQAGQGSAWKTLATLRHARAKPGVAALAGNLYIFGGGWSEGLAANERFDLRAGNWLPIEDTPNPFWRTGGIAALDTKIYLIGGWKGAASDAVLEYTALYRSLIPASTN